MISFTVDQKEVENYHDLFAIKKKDSSNTIFFMCNPLRYGIGYKTRTLEGFIPEMTGWRFRYIDTKTNPFEKIQIGERSF